MECPHCHGRMHNEDKLGMMEKGEWLATNPEADPIERGILPPIVLCSCRMDIMA